MKYVIMVQSDKMPNGGFDKEYSDITVEEARRIYHKTKDANAKYHPLIQMIRLEKGKWRGFMRN